MIDAGTRRLMWAGLAVAVAIIAASLVEHRMTTKARAATNSVPAANLVGTNVPSATADRVALSLALSLLKTNALALTNAAELKANQQLQDVLRRQLGL